jgi:hypothetical protein
LKGETQVTTREVELLLMALEALYDEEDAKGRDALFEEISSLHDKLRLQDQ